MVNGRYTKGVPFLSKIVYKIVRGWTPGGVLPMMAFKARLRPKGVPFSGFRTWKGRDTFHLLKYIKG